MPWPFLDALVENTYGHKRKLLFFIDRIEGFRAAKQVAPGQVKVLDVGCGNATAVTFPIAERGYAVLGLDFHAPSIDYARRVNTLPNVAFRVSDVDALPPEQTYDVVLLSDILEHLQDPTRLLGELRPLLKPDGVVLVSIPNGYGPFEIQKYLCRIRVVRFLWVEVVLALPLLIVRTIRRLRRLPGNQATPVPYNEESGHLQFFTMRAFRRLVTRTGFRISRFEKGCFLCGPFTDLFLGRLPVLIRANVWLGRFLPHFMSSVWYFECRVVGHDPEEP